MDVPSKHLWLFAFLSNIYGTLLQFVRIVGEKLAALSFKGDF
jgi:hypothetical protein